MSQSMPVMPAMCAKCPFKDGSELSYLRADIAASAMTTGRICHSTHRNSAVYGNNPPIKTAHICRGARDLQLKRMYGMGFIAEPTDAAWQAKCDQLGIVRDRIKPKRLTGDVRPTKRRTNGRKN